jgi:hypothetical protein
MSTKKSMPAGLKKYLNALHKAGRKAVKKSGISSKPFYFSGKKRKAKKRRKVSHKRINTALEPSLFTKGSCTMSKKRKTRKARKTIRRASRAVSVYGRRVKHRKVSRRARRYHGGAMGKLRPIAIITEVAGLAGGAIAGSYLAKVVPIANTKIKALIPILAGVVIGQMKFGRSGIGKDLAAGSIAVGALSLARQFVPQIPVFAGVESAQELLTSIQGLSPEEQTLLGYDGSSELGEEVLLGEGAELSPATM